MISRLANTRTKWQWLSILLLAPAVLGCARIAAQGPTSDQRSPNPGPFPLKVALYLDEDFRQYTYRERSFRVPLGEWLSEELYTSLGSTFTEIHVVADQSQLEEEAGQYQAVLRPDIRFASYHPFFRKRRSLLDPEGRVRIYTEWTLSDSAGRKMWIREVVGVAEGDDRSRSRLEAGVEAAMADLIKKLQAALATSTRVHSYAYSPQQR